MKAYRSYLIKKYYCVRKYVSNEFANIFILRKKVNYSYFAIIHDTEWLRHIIDKLNSVFDVDCVKFQ